MGLNGNNRGYEYSESGGQPPKATGEKMKFKAKETEVKAGIIPRSKKPNDP